MIQKRMLAYLLTLCAMTGCAVQQNDPPQEDVLPAVEVITETESASVLITQETTVPPPTEPATTETPPKTEPPADAVLMVDPAIEVYEELTVQSLLTATNVELENGNETVNTSETGTLSHTIRYRFNGECYEHPITYVVEDTTPPLLLNAGWGAEIELGEEFDLTEHVGFADNYDRTPSLTCVGTVNTSVCGTYPLVATAVDDAGNETTWSLNVEVVEQEITPEDNSPRLTFDTLMQQYAGENVRFGIDVSKWQKNIDFEAVRDAGCSFVIMRMGYYYDDIEMDEYYLANMAAAKAAGLDVGVYIYTTANTEAEVRENAQWIARQLDGQELDFPVVFDWESFSNFQQYEMNIHDLNHLFEVFADEMEQLGYDAMLYSSKNFLNNFWHDHSDHPIWLAHYTDETDYAGEYAMWQMSCHGRIHGITGDVDLNILYTDRADFLN